MNQLQVSDKLSFIFYRGGVDVDIDDASKAASPEVGADSSMKTDDVVVDDARASAGDVFTDDASTKSVRTQLF